MTIDELFATPAGSAQLNRAASALRDNGFTTHVVDTVEKARKLVATLVPRDQSVFTATSETLRLSGIVTDLDESGDYQSVRAKAGDLSADVYDQIRLGALPDVVVGSVHAVTEDGHLVVGSATGSQFAPYASGARRAVWVVGAQKIVPDLETGLRRIRTYSLPKENQRVQRYGQSSFLGRILILEREAFPDRATVILIREAIGF